MKLIVVATHNRHKAGEMATILGNRFANFEFQTLADWPGAPEPDETGITYEENVLIKVNSAVAFTNEWCVADDAGLEIDALDGAPGLYSKRFGGEDLPFPEKIALVLDQMKACSLPQRSARFRCYVAVGRPGSAPVVFSATCEGRIALTASGTGGFGYDPIFELPELGCTLAELTAAQKHEVSHRGKVLRSVGDYLETLV